MPSGKDPLKPTNISKAVPGGPPKNDPTYTTKKLVTPKPSWFNPQNEAATGTSGVEGFGSHSVNVGLTPDQGVGHFLGGPGGVPQKKSQGVLKTPEAKAQRPQDASTVAPKEGGSKKPPVPAPAIPTASPTLPAKAPTAIPSKPPVDRKQFLADRRAILSDIVERKKAGTLPPRKSPTPLAPQAASGAKLKSAAGTPKTAPREAGPSDGSRVVHAVPTKVFGDVHVRETAVPGKPPEYGVHPSTMNPEHWARLKHTAEAMGGRAHEGALKFATPRAAKEFADSLAVDPKRRRVRENELGEAVVEELDHADEFDLGGEASKPEPKTPKTPKASTGIARARSGKPRPSPASVSTAAAPGPAEPRSSAPTRDTPSRTAPDAAAPAGSLDSSRQILEAMAKADPATSTGAPITFDRLRPHLTGPLADKDTFDKAVLQMGKDGLVSLHRHDFPKGQPEDAIHQMVPDGQGRGEYYFTISRRLDSLSKPPVAATSTAPARSPKPSTSSNATKATSRPAMKPAASVNVPASSGNATGPIPTRAANVTPAKATAFAASRAKPADFAEGPASFASRMKHQYAPAPTATAKESTEPWNSTAETTTPRKSSSSANPAPAGTPAGIQSPTLPVSSSPTKQRPASAAKAKAVAGKPTTDAPGAAAAASAIGPSASSVGSVKPAKAPGSSAGNPELSTEPEEYEWESEPSSQPSSPAASLAANSPAGTAKGPARKTSPPKAPSAPGASGPAPSGSPASNAARKTPGRTATPLTSSTSKTAASSTSSPKALNKADQAAARKYMSSGAKWKVGGKQHHTQSANLGNAIHWAIKDATEGHGSPELAKVGPYTVQADIVDGKVKGLFLKLLGSRYKVDLDRQAMSGHDPGGHLLDCIKRAIRSIAGNDD